MYIMNWYLIGGAFVSAIFIGIVLKLIYRINDKTCDKLSCEILEPFRDGRCNTDMESICKQCRENGFERI